MSTTTFVNGTTVQPAWLNDLNSVAYKATIMATNLTYAPIGDGITDDTTIMQALFDAGSLWGANVVLEKSKVYAVTFLTLGANLRLSMNGASFKDLNGTTSNTAFLTIQNAVQFDNITLTIPTGKRRDRVVNILGDDVCGNSIVLTSADQQANTGDTDDTAIKFNACDRFHINYIEVNNFDHAVNVETCNNFQIATMNITSYVRAVLASDNKNGFFGPALIATASPNAAASPGHNGLLCQSNTDYAQQNLTFDSWAVQNSGEHAVRCGGAFSHRGITFRDFKIRGHGGCGIKVLGTDLNAPTEYNEGIFIINPLIEDGGSSLISGENRVAIMLEYVKHGTIVNPVVRKVDNTVSASFSIRLNGVEDISIIGGDLNDAQFDSIILHAANGDNKRVTISGTRINTSGRHGVSVFTDVGKTTDNINLHGVQTNNSTQYGFSVANSGTMTNVYVDMVSRADTLGAVLNASANVTFRGAGVTAGAPGWTAANGSLWQDLGTNIYKRVGGAWAAI